MIPRDHWHPHPDWLVPDWPAPERVRAICTTRAGGVSVGPYASLNLGRPSGDDPTAVDANRATLAEALGVTPVYLSQVHGAHASELPMERGLIHPGEADACFTTEPRVVCTMRVADCLPVLFCNRQGSAVAAAHAGWRGLAEGVLESCYRAFETAALRVVPGSTPARVARDTLVWLGPCIGPGAFEVGPEVREAFIATDAGAAGCFQARADGKWLADLPGLARRRLAALGVPAPYGNNGAAAWCTVSNPSRFFSHRRDARVLGGSGRMAACIWLR